MRGRSPNRQSSVAKCRLAPAMCLLGTVKGEAASDLMWVASRGVWLHRPGERSEGMDQAFAESVREGVQRFV